jgi:dTDP-3-amino-3,4,6-trideoxy-alpha-D-glucose transaminase
MSFKVPFHDLGSGYVADRAEVDQAALRVLGSGQWIGGEEVAAFETAWAQAAGSAQAVGVANGTDAITLALWAAGVRPGDEVILPAFSAYPSAVGVMRSGALPVFVDVREEDALIDPALARKALTPRTRAIMPVHLYGNPCAMAELGSIAKEHSLAMVEDCAQAHGLRVEGRPAGSFSAAAAWSFYPTKNLGAAGDAGAVTTDSPELAQRLRRMRNYGQKDRYYHVEEGVNSRLDPLQAAILGARLPKLESRTLRRRAIGARYDEALGGIPQLRRIGIRKGSPGNRHLYPIFADSLAAREALQQGLAKLGVETLVHYPVAMPDQEAAPKFPGQGGFPVARRLADTELSLPIYPEMSEAQVDLVIRALSDTVQRSH